MYDVETGLYDLRFRYYDPAWGRFFNTDSLINGNLFGYCSNNPISKYDSDGLASRTCWNDGDNFDIDSPYSEAGGGGGTWEFSSSPYLTDSPINGWHVGDSLNNYTRNGSFPSWSSIRARFWKNELFYNREMYPEKQWERLLNGKGSINPSDDATLQLHHPYGREGMNIYFFNMVTLTDHMEIHYGK